MVCELVCETAGDRILDRGEEGGERGGIADSQTKKLYSPLFFRSIYTMNEASQLLLLRDLDCTCKALRRAGKHRKVTLH